MLFGTGTSRSNTGHPVHCNGQRINLKVDGAFLVSGCVTDLGEESERVSGYYPTQPDGSNRPWRWDRMRENDNEWGPFTNDVSRERGGGGAHILAQ